MLERRAPLLHSSTLSLRKQLSLRKRKSIEEEMIRAGDPHLLELADTLQKQQQNYENANRNMLLFILTKMNTLNKKLGKKERVLVEEDEDSFANLEGDNSIEVLEVYRWMHVRIN